MNDDTKLEHFAKRLGAAAAERLDVDATARNVVAALRRQPARRRTWIAVHWMRVAAAVVVLLGGGLLVRQTVTVPVDSEHPDHLVADDLGDLTTEQLKDVLERFDEIVGSSTALPDSSDLRELDAQQLRDVLRSLEG
ncbi:MAG TPA: hypothetical protein VGU74_12075 [Gemmatimonadales bacterium]|nr:hypothetical protein [Gemmatimonadales bacterium]